MNMSVLNIDNGGVVLEKHAAEEGLLTFGAAGTEPEGTILQRNGDKWEPFVIATVDKDVALSVLQYPVTAAAAGDEVCWPLTAGKVVEERLVIKAGSPMSTAIRDHLRVWGIEVVPTAELSVLDNQ